MRLIYWIDEDDEISKLKKRSKTENVRVKVELYWTKWSWTVELAHHSAASAVAAATLKQPHAFKQMFVA